MAKRVYAYDLIRVLAAFMVVTVHTGLLVDATWAGQVFFIEITHAILMSCNVIFLMMSGHFNIRERADSELGTYYYHKVRNILVPTFVFILINTFVDMLPGFVGPWAFLKDFALNLLGAYGDLPYWFVFALFGFLMAAPFLGRLFAHMTDRERRLFIVFGLAWDTVDFVCDSMGIRFAWGYPFMSWFFIFCLGGLFNDRTAKQAPTAPLVGIVLAGWAITSFLNITGFSSNDTGAFDESPFFLLMAVCVYFLLVKTCDSIKPARLVSRLAPRTFGVYLIHIMVVGALAPVIPHLIGPASILSHLLLTAATFVVALAAVLVIETALVGPLQRLLDLIVARVLPAGKSA